MKESIPDIGIYLLSQKDIEKTKWRELRIGSQYMEISKLKEN